VNNFILAALVCIPAQDFLQGMDYKASVSLLMQGRYNLYYEPGGIRRFHRFFI
jgi:hypothetical protein